MHKCAYCDFCSYVGLEHLYADYVKALCLQVGRRADSWTDMCFDTVFVGGGTPTVLAPAQVAQILDTCRRVLAVSRDAEVTVEANPGTVDLAGLLLLQDTGVNRLSLGVQSFHDNELTLLGRIHNAQEARQAYDLARQAGFQNVNLDLIFGLPDQSLEKWRETLHRALALGPEHLSLYALTVEETTPLAERISCGALPAPDDDLAADMYEMAESMLDEAGYAHYEISNWARRTERDGRTRDPFWACKHNIGYWHNEEYLGLGASAHSYDGRRRYANVAQPAEYVARVLAGENVVADCETTNLERRMGETMMLGLRLVAGVTWPDFAQRFGVSLGKVYGQEIEQLAVDGLLEVDDEGVRLTPRGRLLGNKVFAAFLRASN